MTAPTGRAGPREASDGFGTPLWIVGSPRSGTTLLRNLLNLHPDVALCAFESKWVPSLLMTVGDVSRLGDPHVRAAAARRVRTGRMYLKSQEEWGSAPTDAQIEAALRPTTWPEVIRDLLDLWCDKDMAAARYWGDKTAVYVDSIELIAAALPGSRFLHAIRDPRDQALSARAVWGKSVTGSADAWARRVRGARGSGPAQAGAYHEVHFEDLVCDPAATLAKLAGWLGLAPFDWPLDEIPVSDQLGRSTGLRHIDRSAATGRRVGLRPRAERRIAALAGSVAVQAGYRLPDVAPRPLGPGARAAYRGLDRLAFARYYVRSWGPRRAVAKLRALARESKRTA